MDCPRCGYALSPFDRECPRCARDAQAEKLDPGPKVPPSSAAYWELGPSPPSRRAPAHALPSQAPSSSSPSKGTLCPGCDEVVLLPDDAQVGDAYSCPHCGALLQVVDIAVQRRPRRDVDDENGEPETGGRFSTPRTVGRLPGCGPTSAGLLLLLAAIVLAAAW